MRRMRVGKRMRVVGVGTIFGDLMWGFGRSLGVPFE